VSSLIATFNVPRNANALSVIMSCTQSCEEASNLRAIQRSVAQIIDVSMQDVQVDFIGTIEGVDYVEISVCAESSELQTLLNSLVLGDVPQLESSSIYDQPEYYSVCPIRTEASSFSSEAVKLTLTYLVFCVAIVLIF
jgi:hypothetical protein